MRVLTGAAYVFTHHDGSESAKLDKVGCVVLVGRRRRFPCICAFLPAPNRRMDRQSGIGDLFLHPTDLSTQPFLVAILGLEMYTVTVESSAPGLIRLWHDRAYRWHVQYQTYVELQMYRTSLTLIRTSAVLFYARIFRVQKPVWRLSLWFTIFIVWTWFFVVSGLSLFPCSPVRMAWEWPGTLGRCLNENQINVAGRVSDVVIDVIVLVLPLPMLWPLQMKMGKKIGVALVFALGYG